MHARSPAPPIGNAATAAFLVVYFLVALWGAEILGGRLAPTTLIWPASGVGLALVLLRGIRVWPLIFAMAAARAVITLEGETMSVVIGSGLVNGAAAALEPVLAAWLVWRLAGESYLARAGPFVLAMLVAAPIAAAVSTLPLIAGAMFAGLITSHSTLGWIATWHSTSASDLMGLLALTPAICIWARHPELRLARRQVVEMLALGTVAVLVLVVPEPGQPYYVLFGIHLAIALRLPLQWSAAAVALSSLVYLWQSSLELRHLWPLELYESFLAEITFVAVLNIATYVAALLHAEAVEEASRREGLLRDREALLRALGRAEQRERRRIAGLLHDNLQQLLVAARMALPSDDSGNRARTLIDEAVEAGRNLAMDLHPPVLDQRGLGAAFRWLGNRFGELHGLDVHVEVDESADPAQAETAYYLFQAARGLLMNVVKHADTDAAWLRLRRNGAWLVVEVEDRGKGCDPSSFHPDARDDHRYGLATMQQRIGLLGGSMEVANENGCRVTLAVPLGAGEGTPGAP